MTTSSIVEMAMHMREATGSAEHSDAFLAGLEKREAEREALREAQYRAAEAERLAQRRADEAERKEQRRADEVQRRAAEAERKEQRRADEVQRRAAEAERKEQHRADAAQHRADQDRFIATVQNEMSLVHKELTLQRWFLVAAVATMGFGVTFMSVA